MSKIENNKRNNSRKNIQNNIVDLKVTSRCQKLTLTSQKLTSQLTATRSDTRKTNLNKSTRNTIAKKKSQTKIRKNSYTSYIKVRGKSEVTATPTPSINITERSYIKLPKQSKELIKQMEKKNLRSRSTKGNKGSKKRGSKNSKKVVTERTIEVTDSEGSGKDGSSGREIFADIIKRKSKSAKNSRETSPTKKVQEPTEPANSPPKKDTNMESQEPSYESLVPDVPVQPVPKVRENKETPNVPEAPSQSIPRVDTNMERDRQQAQKVIEVVKRSNVNKESQSAPLPEQPIQRVDENSERVVHQAQKESQPALFPEQPILRVDENMESADQQVQKESQPVHKKGNLPETIITDWNEPKDGNGGKDEVVENNPADLQLELDGIDMDSIFGESPAAVASEIWSAEAERTKLQVHFKKLVEIDLYKVHQVIEDWASKENVQVHFDPMRTVNGNGYFIIQFKDEASAEHVTGWKNDFICIAPRKVGSTYISYERVERNTYGHCYNCCVQDRNIAKSFAAREAVKEALNGTIPRVTFTRSGCLVGFFDSEKSWVEAMETEGKTFTITEATKVLQVQIRLIQNFSFVKAPDMKKFTIHGLPKTTLLEKVWLETVKIATRNIMNKVNKVMTKANQEDLDQAVIYPMAATTMGGKVKQETSVIIKGEVALRVMEDVVKLGEKNTGQGVSYMPDTKNG